MSVYEVAPRARKEMYDAAIRARQAMQYGVIRNGLWHRVSHEEARQMYWAEVNQILKTAHVEVNPDKPVAIQCEHCKKVSMIARDVKTFCCSCSSYEEQWVCKSRYFDTHDGTRVLDIQKR